MIATERSPAGHAATAYFPSGNWEYKKSFELSPGDAGSAVFLEFDGVYRDALVRVNDAMVAHRPGGYSDFTVQVDHLLRFGEPNEVKVEARAHDDSRWYSGAGIYRSVWLLQAGRVHLVPGGLRLVTPEVDDDVAMVAVSAEVRNQSAGMSNAVLRAGDPRRGREVRRHGGGTGHDGAGRCPHGPATPLCSCTTSVGSRRSLPLHVPGQLAGRRPGRGRGVDDVRNPDVDGRPQAGIAHQRGARPLAWCLCPPRQRPARCGHDRSRRGTPGRAPQGGRIQRDQERPQPLEQADARGL